MAVGSPPGEIERFNMILTGLSMNGSTYQPAKFIAIANRETADFLRGTLFVDKAILVDHFGNSADQLVLVVDPTSCASWGVGKHIWNQCMNWRHGP